MDNKIYFSIPDFWQNYDLNMAFLSLYISEREKFNDDVIIDNIYGSFPCIWNGGRVIGGQTNKQNILDTIAPFQDMGIGIRLTFSNLLLEPKHMADTLGNTILQLCDNGKTRNSITCGTKVMMDYVEQNYPNYYCLWSTTLCQANVDSVNLLSKNHIVILDYRLNNNFKALMQLQHPENIEVLNTELCIDNCPNREAHYKSISEFNLLSTTENFPCKNPRFNFSYYDSVHNNKSYISLQDLREKYLPLGINKVKINGRKEHLVNVLERYIEYLVKPEYKDYIRNKVLLQIYK